METIPVTAERKAQLDDYARRHGQDAATAADDALAAWLEGDEQHYLETVESIKRGYADFRAGRTQPAETVFEELRLKHALPR